MADSGHSYVLFSIGNIKPLFQATFATCWKSFAICNETWIEAIDYMEVVGIIVGQVLVGILGDWFVGARADTFGRAQTDDLTGLVDDGVLFKMLSSCSLASSCSSVHGVPPRMDGSFAMFGLYSSTE